ncbi:MAG: hypothetical protein P4L10_16880, partial [Acidobacteriaceae bacterium]|nr:hypothetical protein [Acidobacteriaceae bacterium]
MLALQCDEKDRLTSSSFQAFLRLAEFFVSFAPQSLPYLIVPIRYVQSQQSKNEVASMSAKYVFVTGGVV